MRYLLVLAVCFGLNATLCRAAEPAGGLSCEQLFAAAKSAVQYRDEGYTLSQVLAALKGAQSEGKLTAADVETLRRTINEAYLGSASPEAIGIECREARGKK